MFCMRFYYIYEEPTNHETRPQDGSKLSEKCHPVIAVSGKLWNLNHYSTTLKTIFFNAYFTIYINSKIS
jgi:hypothetical protein